MPRVKFKKGKQREFLNKVLEVSNCPSFRELKNRGFDVSYDCLKNYCLERRLIPEEFFFKLCSFAKINSEKFDFEIVRDNFGQIKGGMLSKKPKKLEFKGKFK